MAEMPSLPSESTLLEEYTVRASLLRGGDFTLYAAEQRSTGRSGLLRVYDTSLASPRRRQHILSRAQLMRELEPAGFAPIYEVGEFPDHRCYVFSAGDPATIVGARALVKQSPSELFQLVAQLSDSLSNVARLGILYLDLWPSNILWIPGTGSGEPSRALLLPSDNIRFAQAATAKQSTLSEEEFAAPCEEQVPYQPEEQRGGGTIDQKTIVGALGATLYSLRYGRRPSEDPVRPAAESSTHGPLLDCLDQLIEQMRLRYQPGRPDLDLVRGSLNWLACVSSLFDGALIDSRYKIERPLGIGGMGIVFAGRDQKLRGVPVAVKVPYLPQAGPRMLQEFETALVASQMHRDVVRILDYGSISIGVPYLVMEYVEGQTLADRLAASRGRLPRAEALRTCSHLAEILVATHAAQVIHRDLKPQNIMLVPDPAFGEGGRPRLLDFGIAKLRSTTGTLPLRPSLTRIGMPMGTPKYMPPEQLVNSAGVDARADVYSLGAMLYEMLGGDLPPRDPPEAVAKGALFSILQAMLDAEPGRRPPMQEVAVGLQQIAGREGVRRSTLRQLALLVLAWCCGLLSYALMSHSAQKVSRVAHLFVPLGDESAPPPSRWPPSVMHIPPAETEPPPPAAALPVPDKPPPPSSAFSAELAPPKAPMRLRQLRVVVSPPSAEAAVVVASAFRETPFTCPSQNSRPDPVPLVLLPWQTFVTPMGERPTWSSEAQAEQFKVRLHKKWLSRDPPLSVPERIELRCD